MVNWVSICTLPPKMVAILLCHRVDSSIVMGRYVYDSGNQGKWRIDVTGSPVWWDVEDFSHWVLLNKPGVISL